GSAAQTRTPTDSCDSTSRRAPTSASTALETSERSLRLSTVARARPSDGRRQQRLSPDTYSWFNRPALRRPLEPGIVVPAEQVCGVAQACAEKGLDALVVISAGFSEVGCEGRERQAEPLEICRRSGMRLIGPNCVVILNTDPGHPLDATFGPTFPSAGRVGFMLQSGALGLAVMDQARRMGL